MNKFTPAPWDCTGCMFPDDDMGGVYYRIQADGITASAANSRLIALAPEMYEYIASSASNGCATAQALLARTKGGAA